MTEDDVVILLKRHLENNDWIVGSNYCLGQKRGPDIKARKGNNILIVEAKGAKANDSSPTKKRKYFDTGQIKTHFGKALVKILEMKKNMPDAFFAIAHPDDPDVRRAIGGITTFLKELNIKHFWVARNKIIEE